MKIQNIFFHNTWLKLLSLLLAFLTWVYVGELTKMDSSKTVLQKLLSPADYMTKKLRVKPIFVGTPPDGRAFSENAVKITPEYIVVIGPSSILSKKEFIYTMPIDLSERTKTKTVDVELERISRPIRFQKTKVEVYLPIEDNEESKSQ